MIGTSSRSGLVTRLLLLCGAAALLGAVIATIAFHSYRTTKTNDRLATELTAQAHAIALLVADRLDAGDMAGTGHSSEKPLWHARQPCCVNVTAHGHATRLPGGADARNITSPLSGVLAV
jgi:hypothetical protein